MRPKVESVKKFALTVAAAPCQSPGASGLSRVSVRAKGCVFL